MEDDEIDKFLRELGLELPDVEADCEDDGPSPRLDEEDWESWA